MSPRSASSRSWLIACLLFACASLSTLAWAGDKGLGDLAGPMRLLAQNAAAGNVNTAAVSKLGVRAQGNLVQTEILFTSEAAAVATGLGKFGGQVQARHDRRVQAMLPVTELMNVADLPQVAQVRPPKMMRPLQGYGAYTSQGVQLTNATAFHLSGYYGSNVKVAIIDTGFAGLTAAEVPVTAAQEISFRSDGSMTAGGPHGTAVAQIVADMAPGCTMELVAVDTELSLLNAIDWVIEQNYKVVNMSLGVDDGPFDDTHPLCVAVNKAVNAGIFWANAAGNEAQRHWEGDGEFIAASDGSMYQRFASGKDYIALDLGAGSFEADLSWYQTSPGTTDRDYDLVLFDSGDNLVARSAVQQDGDDPPVETLVAYVATAGTYHLRIQRMPNSAIPDQPDKFQLFTPEVDLESTVQVSADSLCIPAVASGAFAVGATRATSYLPAAGQPLAGLAVDQIEPFSSRGPLNQSLKPELCGPDAVSISNDTALASLNPFLGTSAASPHVAGAAALLLSESSARTAAQLRSILTTNRQVISHVAADDNAYGAGRLSLRVGLSTGDEQAPTVNIDFPTNNSTITAASPKVQMTFTDTTGIDPASIQIWYDPGTTTPQVGDASQIIRDGAIVSGANARDFTLDSTSGECTFMMDNLTRTHHTLAARVSDLSGNMSTVVFSNFRITTPTISAGVHIIGLPYPNLATTDPSEVFGVPLSSLTLIRWVPTDSRVSKYHVYPDDYASFSPPDDLVPNPPAGLGYFLSLPTTGTLSASAGGVTTDSYSIKLVYGNDAPRGWNLIGNPYEGYVDWGSVQLESANGRQDLSEAINDSSPVTEGVLFDFVSTAGGGYYSFPADPTQDRMEPLKGYWLHVLKAATLIVYNTGNTTVAATTHKSSKPAAVSATNWTLQLGARCGKYEDPVNYIGVASKATDGYDPGLDVSEPPPLVDSLRMYMAGSGSDLAKDVRSAGDAHQEWAVDVACRLQNVPVTVSWPMINAAVPRAVTLRLEDTDTGKSVYMRTATGYTFTMAEPGVRHLKITASTDASANLAVTGLAAAQNNAGGIALTYTLSQPATVTVEVRNMAGVLIRTLGQSEAAAGASQTVMWNGRNEHGSRSPAGKYFARITACAADGQTVQALRPFSISR